MSELRSWLDYNPDTVPRPSTTKTKMVKQPRFWGNPKMGYYPTDVTKQTYQDTKVSPYEILDELKDRFNRAPVSYKTDPVTGKVIASRSMAKPELPREMGQFGRFRRYFGEGDLTSNWVLPKDALTGPTTIQRTAPQSDVTRQMAYSAGVSNTGTTRATLNPRTFWPSSAFKVPMREAYGAGQAGQGFDPRTGYTGEEPVFGGTVDYTTGKWHTPSYYKDWEQPYGRFDISKKTPPRLRAWPQVAPAKSKSTTQPQPFGQAVVSDIWKRYKTGVQIW